MTPIQVGDEVRVFDVNGRRMNQPEGGWIGHVKNVGRTLAHIDYPGGRGTEGFKLSDGQRPGGRRWFKTLDRVARDDRMCAAQDILIAVGVELNYRNRLTLEQIEALAEVAKTFGRTD